MTLPGHIADFTVTSAPPNGAVIPPDYLGLSIEWSMVPYWFGTSEDGVKSAFVNVLTALRRPDTSGVLRIGGNSQDGHHYVAGGCRDENALFDGVITEGMLNAIFEVADQAGWGVIIGVNLRTNDPGNAAALVGAVHDADIGNKLRAVELGNEVNGYFSNTSDYLTRINQYLSAIDATVTDVPITGPAISENADVAYAAALWNAHRDRMPFATFHDYANQPNIASLLQTSVITSLRDRITAMNGAIGFGHSRMGEGNSVGSGGLNGVSNVAGVNAWLVDALCEGARSGLLGFNLHSWDGFYFPDENRTCFYTPFVIRRGQAASRPPFYGLALAKHMPGRRVCPVQTSNATGQLVRAWAFQDPTTDRIYVYVLNKGGVGDAGRVSVTGPSVGSASVNVLQTGGCSYGDPLIQGQRLQTDGTFSYTGTPIGAVTGTTRYEFDVPECGVALLSMPG